MPDPGGRGVCCGAHGGVGREPCAEGRRARAAGGAARRRPKQSDEYQQSVLFARPPPASHAESRATGGATCVREGLFAGRVDP